MSIGLVCEGGLNHYNISLQKRKDGTDNSEAVVPNVIKPPQASPPKNSATTSKTYNRGRSNFSNNYSRRTNSLR
jgi:hypothetical protein